MGSQLSRYIIVLISGYALLTLGACERRDRADELKALITQAKPILQKHLERAEEIQRKLGEPGA